MYDPVRAHDFATTAAQVVPVLLLAALALPLRTRGRVTGGSQPRALVDLLATAILIGLALLTEFAALFGVYSGLSRHDARLLATLVGFTVVASAVRILMPEVQIYAHAGRIPQGRIWLILGTVVAAAFAGFLIALN